MAILFFAAILSVCLFLVDKVLIAPIDFMTALHLPGWTILVSTLLLLSWLMAE